MYEPIWKLAARHNRQRKIIVVKNRKTGEKSSHEESNPIPFYTPDSSGNR